MSWISFLTCKRKKSSVLTKARPNKEELKSMTKKTTRQKNYLKFFKRRYNSSISRVFLREIFPKRKLYKSFFFSLFFVVALRPFFSNMQSCCFLRGFPTIYQCSVLYLWMENCLDQQQMQKNATLISSTKCRSWCLRKIPGESLFSVDLTTQFTLKQIH